MFTGIVEERGEVVALDLAPDGADARVTVRGPLVTQDVKHGESIAVSGVCLTVVASSAGTFTADVMAETLLRTSAKEWSPGRPVNLERSVTPTTRLGGHLVQGHIDGVGTVVARVPHEGWDEFSISVSQDLARYIAGKGSVAVDGISLTVIDVTDSPTGAVFTLGIIPETRTATTLGSTAVGSSVNIEVDVMAKYAERLLSFRPTAGTVGSSGTDGSFGTNGMSGTDGSSGTDGMDGTAFSVGTSAGVDSALSDTSAVGTTGTERNRSEQA